MHLSKFPTKALWPGRASRLCGFRFNFRFQIHSTSQPMDSEYALSMDSKSAGQFQLAHTRGSAFFSLRALTPQASANLNVRWNHRTYVFELVESGIRCCRSSWRLPPIRTNSSQPLNSHRPEFSRCSTKPKRFHCSRSSIQMQSQTLTSSATPTTRP